MKNNSMVLASALLVVLASVVSAEPPSDSPAKAPVDSHEGAQNDSSSPGSEAVRAIGVYDSRSVAIAFVGSKVYEATAGKELAEKMAAYEKAKAAGDEDQLAELEAWGKAQQQRLHKQGFSTAPVADILKHIDDKLPQIAKAAGVDRLISKWDEQALAGHPSARRVDVTESLIDAFEPNERQRNAALGIRKHRPLSLDKAEKIDD